MTTIILYSLCALAYAVLAIAALVNAGRRRRPSRSGVWLALGCLATAGWAAAGAVQWQAPLDGVAGDLDLLRAAVWYGLILHLYRRVTPGAAAGPQRTLGAVAIAALVIAGAAALPHGAALGRHVTLESGGLLLRLVLAICQLLLVENLFRNTPDEVRWNISLTCLALGGLAAFDVILCAEAALFHVASPALLDARPVVAALVTPLLAVAAARNRNWEIDIHLSRSAVFHSATLLVSGVFLLVLALAGELARRVGDRFGGSLGLVAEISLLFAGVMTVVVLLVSGSARSLLRRLAVDHFFTSRFDYRREWIRCVETLSAASPLHRRVICAVVQAVDSPAGALLLREPGEGGMHWAGSWNLPPITAPVPEAHPLLTRLAATRTPLLLDAATVGTSPLDVLPSAWLAVPLLDDAGVAGCILATRPRAPFPVDAETFDLLRILAHEACSYLAEQRATRAMLEARELREYGQRFAFVAHDIKNVSSQLSLLLSNADTHLANPEFQRDMLATVGASVRKIGALIRRLQESDDPLAGAATGESVSLPERLQAVAEATQRVRGCLIGVEHDGWHGRAAIAPAAFDAVVTHLLDNAVEASPPQAAIRLHLRRTTSGIHVDIVDQGIGMTPEFVRDELFRPFSTSKPHGSGIGAYQARALLREAGGDLQADSAVGRGTTMRLRLREATDAVAVAVPAPRPPALSPSF